MDFGWTAEQTRLHDRMLSLGRELTALAPSERMGRLAAEGVLGLAVSASEGGGGADLVTTARAFEALGATLPDAGLLLAAGAHLFGVALVVERAGSDAQRARFLGELCRGERLGAVAATERESGSDVAACRGEVDLRPEGGVGARGDKCWVTSGACAGLYLFVGRAVGLARGLSVALVPAETPGVRPGAELDTAGLRSARLAPVAFDCELPEGALLGKHGAGMAVFQQAMAFERALVLAFRLGAMARQLEEAHAFAARRRPREPGAEGGAKAAGAPILSHDAVSHRLARMKRRLETSRLLVYRAAWALDRGERATSEAALAKWQLAEAAMESALDAAALRGAAGYLAAEPFAADVLDALGGSIHSGTADVLATIVARTLR